MASAPVPAIVPCGPECRHAAPLPLEAGEWVWCARCGAPRATGAAAEDCPAFAARSDLDLPAGGREFAAMTWTPAPAVSG